MELATSWSNSRHQLLACYAGSQTSMTCGRDHWKRLGRDEAEQMVYQDLFSKRYFLQYIFHELKFFSGIVLVDDSCERLKYNIDLTQLIYRM